MEKGARRTDYATAAAGMKLDEARKSSVIKASADNQRSTRVGPDEANHQYGGCFSNTGLKLGSKMRSSHPQTSFPGSVVSNTQLMLGVVQLNFYFSFDSSTQQKLRPPARLSPRPLVTAPDLAFKNARSPIYRPGFLSVRTYLSIQRPRSLRPL